MAATNAARPDNLTRIPADRRIAKRVSGRHSTVAHVITAVRAPDPVGWRARGTAGGRGGGRLGRLDATALRDWAHTAVDDLIAHTDEINRLNVFPVADADTGTNMLFTMRAACGAADSAAGRTAT